MVISTMPNSYRKVRKETLAKMFWIMVFLALMVGEYEKVKW